MSSNDQTTTIDTDLLETWGRLCKFSEYRKYAFGSRDNQIYCEARGETVKPTDERFISACAWLVSVFLYETMPDNVKKIPDWLEKAKQSLAVVVDVSIDQFAESRDIYSLEYFNEAIQAVVYCVKNYDED